MYMNRRPWWGIQAARKGQNSLSKVVPDLCQTLASQGKVFKVFVTIVATFTFSLDTRATLPTRIQERKSPSTPKRNAKRREDFTTLDLLWKLVWKESNQKSKNQV